MRSSHAFAQAVQANVGHPAIFGYLVGNEIASTMVRWLGVRRVTEFVEHLIRIGRAIDPDVLYSYATYPPTEYLLPQNVDFFCFNVYLHNQRDFERYLLRLQNLTDERPLILGEFGMDTIRHSQDEQAEMLGWHIDSVVKCGLAGTIFFRLDGRMVHRRAGNHRLGLRHCHPRARTEESRFTPCAINSGRTTRPCGIRRCRKRRLCRSSFVPTTARKTLAACLESLGKLNYPDYEVILVDDGSTDNTPRLRRSSRMFATFIRRTTA